MAGSGTQGCPRLADNDHRSPKTRWRRSAAARSDKPNRLPRGIELYGAIFPLAHVLTPQRISLDVVDHGGPPPSLISCRRPFASLRRGGSDGRSRFVAPRAARAEACLREGHALSRR